MSICQCSFKQKQTGNHSVRCPAHTGYIPKVIHKQTRVRATKDFIVGPKFIGKIAVAKDAVRKVSLLQDGKFTTETDDGRFFGVCQVGQGWEIIK